MTGTDARVRVTNTSDAEVDWDDPASVDRAVLAVRLLISEVPQAELRERLWDGLREALGADLYLDWLPRTSVEDDDRDAFEAELGSWARKAATALAEGDADALRWLAAEALILRDEYRLAICLRPDDEEAEAYWLQVLFLERFARLALVAAEALSELYALDLARTRARPPATPPRFTPHRRRPSAGPAPHAPPLSSDQGALRGLLCARGRSRRRTVPI